MSDIHKHHGIALERLIRQSGKKKGEIAKDLSVDASTLSRMFNKKIINQIWIEKFCQYFNVDQTYFTEAEKKQSPSIVEDLVKRLDDLTEFFLTFKEEIEAYRKDNNASIMIDKVRQHRMNLYESLYNEQKQENERQKKEIKELHELLRRYLVSPPEEKVR